MSSSYNTECQLRQLAEKLSAEANSLFDAADVLRILREAGEHYQEIAAAKSRAQSWIKP
jgi:hypothetical protein